MSYNYRILNDRPRHYYPLVEGALAWNDATGRANGAVVGTPTTAPPLVVGGGNSYVMDGSNHFRFLSSVFYLDSPTRPFSLEAWFKPVSVSEPKGILGHTGQNDGLMFDGESISFTTLHGPAGAATARYFPSDTSTSFYVLGVHTESRNELYVNGIRVASVDLTEEQLLSDYTISTAPGYLYAGHRPGTIIVDSVAVYGEALTGRQAKLHFLWGRDVPDLRDVIQKRGGEHWDFTDGKSDVAFDFHFDTDIEWQDAQAASVTIRDGILSPALAADGTSAAGTWVAGFILPSIIEPKVDGSKIEFDGDGDFAVHTSMNEGTTWSPAVSGREVTGLAKGATTTGKSLQVRVTFPAGANAITKVRNLSIKLYRSRDSLSTNGSPAVLTGKVGLASNAHQPIEHADYMGLELYSGGVARIDAVAGFRTFEFWVKRNTDTVFTLFDGLGTGTTYVNGVAGPQAYVTGRWYHVVFVTSAAVTGPMNLNVGGTGDISLGIIAAYPQAMAAADVAGLYNAYMGIPNQQVVESTGLIVRDAPTDTVKIYSYDWSTVASG